MSEANSEQSKPLLLQGNSTDHIWIMTDGEEPHAIGVRMDCGDSGAVYLTRAQAAELAQGLTAILAVSPAPGGSSEPT